MRDIVEAIAEWTNAGEAFALATVVSTWSSAPRQPGASMAVAQSGEVVGSVSGGCVESAVYEVARDVLGDGQTRLASYGVADADAFEAGLTCGGGIEVLVQLVDPHSPEPFSVVLKAIQDRLPVAMVTALPGQPAAPGRTPPSGRLVVLTEEHQGLVVNRAADQALADRARSMLAYGTSGVVHVGCAGQQRHDEVAAFVHSFAPPPRMLVFGAIDFATALSRAGKFLGYHVTVCDARPIFATRRRFPDADEVVVDWPHRFLADAVVDERTVICVLTHDPKFDVPLLKHALTTPAGYIGVMGSRRTHDDRTARLLDEGVNEDQLARLHSPIGLDLGARTPEETAISIVSEIIANSWGGSGAPLHATSGLIHR